MEDSIYWHCFRKIPGIGQTRLRSIMSAFQSGEAAWQADAGTLSATGMSRDTLGAIVSGRGKIDPEQEEHELGRLGIRVLPSTDDDFPPLLRETPFPIALLYVRGNLKKWNHSAVSVVGSRRYTAYGRQVAERLSTDLARAGVVVVSGLAYGIDSVAHETVLRERGITVAVLGNGLDDASIHPKDHLRLAERITESGVLLSEYPPGTAASRGTFPARNRIIAGISLGTVVVEASERSGSLITANHALECGREVFSVPGPIFSPASVGTNRLIQNGAKLVRAVGDILGELPLSEDGRSDSAATKTESVSALEDLSLPERKILSLLTHEPAHVDEIIKSSHLGTDEAGSALTILELKGIARNIGGDRFIRL